MIDDDGSGQTGTIINNAWKQELYDQVDGAIAAIPAPPASSPSVLVVVLTSDVGTVNDWAPAGLPTNANAVISWNGATPLLVTGIRGGVDGQQITIKNRGTSVISFEHSGTGSIITNRCGNLISSGMTPVAAAGWISYVYFAGSGWRLTSHEQGAWITPAFNAADYTASTGTWIVSSANVLQARYRIEGKALAWALYVWQTSISPGAQAQRKLFGYTAPGYNTFVHMFVEDPGPGFGPGQHNGTIISFYKNAAEAGFTGTLRINCSGLVELT
jgi:hypothetical protein